MVEKIFRISGGAQVNNKEENVLFNILFCLQLYVIGHMVKDHSDSKRGNTLPPLLFSVSSKGSFICTIPQTGEHIPLPFK